MARICWECSMISCFIYGFVFQVICEKTLRGNDSNPLQPGVAFLRFSDIFRGYRKATPGCNGLIPIWETFLYAKNCNYNFYKLSYKFNTVPYLSSRANQKRRSNFQQVSCLVPKIVYIFLFIVSRALLQTHTEYTLF